MATHNQPITALDYDDIRQNLTDFYRSQTVFSDYDYAGSGLSQLINILAYNTHYNAYLANAVINEGFLDSAVKRGSAISRAKESGYTPRSSTSAIAIVDIMIPAPVNSPGILTLEKYTPFTSSVGGNSFKFYNLDAVTAPIVNGSYTFKRVQLYEGTLITNTFIVTSNNNLSDTTFTIPNANVDTGTIEVIVQQSATDSRIAVWKQESDFTIIDSSSKVYFVQANAQELYDIQFGDGVLGASLDVGNVVIINYLVSSADAANVASTYPQTFSCGGIGGNTGLVINTIQNSIGGMPPETIDEIKFRAPLAYKSNNRAVTEDDYFEIISKYASAVKSVAVYGGEKASPPVYGKVFISLEPVTGYYIPDTLKKEIAEDVIKSRNMVTVTPEFIDPDYIFLTLEVNLEYDKNQTTLSSADIESAVQNSINNYINTSLGQFKQPFYFSQLSKVIDNSNDSILGNMLAFNIQKRFSVNYGQPSYINCNFGSEVRSGSFFSNAFTYYNQNELTTAILVDDSAGNLQIQDFNNKTVIIPKIGTIDYVNGIANIKGLVVNSITGTETQLKLSATPIIEVSNILPNNNQIILVDDSSASIVDNVQAGINISASPAKTFGVK